MLACTQTFENGGANLKLFLQRGCESLENSDFEAKIKGVSDEKLHGFEIICVRTPAPLTA